MACILKPGWMATVFDSPARGLPVSAIFDDLVFALMARSAPRSAPAFGRDQRAGVRNYQREPTMVTTERATAFRRRRSRLRRWRARERRARQGWHMGRLSRERQDVHRRSNTIACACPPSARSAWFQADIRVAGSPEHLFQAGEYDRGSDLGFRRRADHLAVRGVSRYETERGLPADIIRRTNAANHLENAWAKFERAEVDIEAFRRIVRGRIAGAGRGGSRQGRAAAAVGRLRPEMVEALKRVKARFKTGCITNNLPANAIGSHSGRSLYVAEVMVLFDHVIESAKIGLRKPDPRIYRMMVETLQVDPKNCVYLDDLGVNLKPAREMGMTTIKVLNARRRLRAGSGNRADIALGGKSRICARSMPKRRLFFAGNAGRTLRNLPNSELKPRG
jgi:putative hydrolase of the HAD superfamily